jgi:ribosomal-protein-alanine N-acetyltransferase
MIVAGPGAGETLAALHAAAFDEPWSGEALEALLTAPGVIGLMREDGFILIRIAADEAEILTLAVRPQARRRGLGGALVEAGAEAAHAANATSLFLEVAADNRAAIALYARSGFQQVGRRKGYYAREGGAPVDALVLARSLASAA